MRKIISYFRSLLKRREAKRECVPYKKRMWYNYRAMLSKDSLAEESFIEIFDESGRYISCPGIGGTVIYNNKGRRYLYEIVGFYTMTYDEWQGYLKEMGYDGPEMPFKPGDKVRLVNQSDADMNGRKAVVWRAYPNKRTNKIDVEIMFDDDESGTYLYNDYDLEKEE